MRYLLLAGTALAVLASPMGAQESPVTLAVFLTVRTENVPEFEEAARAHARWHAEQEDPQAWPAYQALTGHGEYAFIAPDMSWASLDDPSLDMSEDVAHWSTSGAPYAETEDFVLWTNVPGGSPPADASDYPVVQVYEFEIQRGGQAAVMSAIEEFSAAMADESFHWEWSVVVSRDGPPSVFIAVWADSFASLGAGGDTPAQMMTEHFGPERADLIMDSFAEATRAISSQIWVLRPDLSYFPE